MTIASLNRARIGHILETVVGTTPATPAFAELPYDKFDVVLSRNTISDNSIRSDGMARYVLYGDNEIKGSIEVKLTHGYYDLLLQSLARGPWTTNVLKSGTATTTGYTLAMEEQHLDISQYIVFNGLLVDSLEVTIPTSGVVTAKFGIVGLSQSALSATTFTGATWTAATVKNPFTDYGSAGFVKEGGSTVGYVQSLNFKIDNNYKAEYAAGANVAHDFTMSNRKVTGTVVVFFEDSTMYNKFVSGTASSIDYKLDNGTNQLEFNFPNIRYLGVAKSLGGSGAITLSMPFEAIYDGTSTSHFVITRT
jgi:hypothetical protein